MHTRSICMHTRSPASILSCCKFAAPLSVNSKAWESVCLSGTSRAAFATKPAVGDSDIGKLEEEIGESGAEIGFEEEFKDAVAVVAVGVFKKRKKKFRKEISTFLKFLRAQTNASGSARSTYKYANSTPRHSLAHTCTPAHMLHTHRTRNTRTTHLNLASTFARHATHAHAHMHTCTPAHMRMRTLLSLVLVFCSDVAAKKLTYHRTVWTGSLLSNLLISFVSVTLTPLLSSLLSLFSLPSPTPQYLNRLEKELNVQSNEQWYYTTNAHILRKGGWPLLVNHSFLSPPLFFLFFCCLFPTLLLLALVLFLPFLSPCRCFPPYSSP